MNINLNNRSLCNLLGFTGDEINYLLQLATRLKANKHNHCEKQLLSGKHFVMLFEKPSTRTRCAFEVAARDQGANVTYLGQDETHFGYKESIKDSARVLSRYYDGIFYRGFDQETINQLAKYASIPVWNGLTNQFHPTQTLADLFTLQEQVKKPLSEQIICYIGDANCNVAHSLLIGAAKLGLDCRIAAPKAYYPDPFIIQKCQEIAELTHGKITLTENIDQAVVECDAIYTDVWVSMGEPSGTWKEKIAQLKPYQVNQAVFDSTNNSDCKFMHCLPAFHNDDTTLGQKILAQHHMTALEVTDDIFESEHSIVFDQAENRLHTIKALLVATAGDKC